MARGLVCRSCAMFLRIKKNGVTVEEGMPLGPVQADGGPESWGPYKLWQGDLYACPGCGFELVTGFAGAPLAEHYEPTYADTRRRFEPLVRVDDCGGSRP
jgi:hypothetical protein